MPFQQLLDFFKSKEWCIGWVHPGWCNLSATGSNTKLNLGYVFNPAREIYLSVYYARKGGRLERYYQNVLDTLEERMQNCRANNNWANVCNTLRPQVDQQQRDQWYPLCKQVEGHGHVQFRFERPYHPEDNLSPEFLKAIGQLADILIANFP